MRCVALLALVCLTACGDAGAPLPAVDLQIRLEADTRSVHPGQGFLLDVVRTWRKGLEPSPWDDRLLAPLVVRAQGVTTREDARRIQETRRFRAYVFSRDDVTVPAVPFAGNPVDGGELRIAAARPLRLRVEPEVDAEAPGAPELPGDLPEQRSAWWILLAVVLALAAGAAFVARRRSSARTGEPAEPVLGPEVRAHEALARIRAQHDVDPLRAVLAVADVVRDYAVGRFGVTDAQTTEELALIPGIADVLAPCDRAKFATHVPDGVERDAVLDAAEQFVAESTP